MNSPERWREIEAVLEAALEADTRDRAALLDRACAGNPELRREVESLLDADRVTGRFFEGSADAFAAAVLGDPADDFRGAESPGNIVGSYRLLSEIGHGGMGRVWLAERADGQFEQRVAIKVIKRGMDTDAVLARFLRERQILARLEHPNIARLLDGGLTEDGRPYFVMEHVPGLPITEHCERYNVGIDERLRLFVAACRAASYAHRNLVVHRDLKPSNVLVTDQGEVKLLDFGIAKFVSEHGDDVTLAGALMTPEYASPEQLAGNAVTTASDVFQLGTLLHELVTGNRGSDHRPTNSRKLRGDLFTIQQRAARTEPDLRYPSAEDLAEDIERQLADLPIRFGGDNFSYRAGKFARRHRIAVATALTILGLIVGIISFYTLELRSERDRARREAAKSMEAARLVGRFFQNWNPDPKARVEVTAIKVVGDAAVRATRELNDDPEMLAATLSILGDLQTSLGQWEAADSLLARAYAIQERLPGQSTADLAVTIARRGRFHALRGDHDAAEAAMRRAVAIDRSLLGPAHNETLRVQRELAGVLLSKKELREAEQLLRGIIAAIPAPDRNTSPLALEAASLLGYVLFDGARYDEAIAILRPTLARQRNLFGDVHLPTLQTLRFLASALRDSGRLAEAEVMYRAALRTAQALYGEPHIETARSLVVLAIVLQRKEELEEAESLSQRATAIYERNLGTDHFETANQWVGHAGILLDRGNLSAAERDLRKAHVVFRQSFPAGHIDEGDILNRLAYILVRRGARDADSFYRQAVTFDDARAPGSPVFVTDGFHYLAWARHTMGDLAGAEATYRRALGLYRRQLPEGHAYRIAAEEGMVAVLRDAGRNAEAESYVAATRPSSSIR